jgi:DNA-directed RNA polymerase specialized sigma24 family protein
VLPLTLSNLPFVPPGDPVATMFGYSLDLELLFASCYLQPMLRPRLLQPRSHEDLFLARYDRLSALALQLTNGDRSAAGDLLHNAFLHFAIGRPELSGIANLDAYLATTLRNTHVSEVRRLASGHASTALIDDCHSAEVCLRRAGTADQIGIQGELLLVCEYACRRKERSKAASVLLLRFFQGYYPREIASLLRVTPNVVKSMLATARMEAKRHAGDPGESPANSQYSALSRHISYEEFLDRLRRTIQASSEPPCLSAKDWRHVYRRDGPPLSTSLAAHLASCPACLEEATCILRLPSYSDRHPNDTLGPDAPQSGSGRSRKEQLLDRDEFRRESLRRRREITEDPPRRLTIAVNGRAVGVQAVESNRTQLSLRIAIDEPIAFVTVHNEQGAQLLLLNAVRPPEGELEQELTMDFGGRRIAARLDFRGYPPELHLTYEGDGSETGIEREPDAVMPERAVPWWRRLWLRPLAFWCALALIAAFLILRNPSQRVDAAGLMARVRASDEAAIPAQAVSHRVVRVEERNARDGRVKAARTVDSWRSAKRVEAIRVYDDRRQLTRARWTGAQANAVEYPAAGAAKTSAWSLDEVSLSPLSAAGFEELAGSVEGAVVDREVAAYSVRWRANPTTSNGLVEASLRISERGWRAIEQRLVVTDDRETTEFRFVETSFEVVDLPHVPAYALEPDTAEKPAAAKPETVTGRMQRPIPQLAVEIAAVLDSVQAFEGEQVEVTRLADDRLDVYALVEDAARKQQLDAALISFSGVPGLAIRVETFAEHATHHPAAGGLPVRLTEVPITQGAMGAEQQMRKFLAPLWPDPNRLDREVVQLAQRVRQDARLVRQHAGAIARIAAIAPVQDLPALSDEAQRRWKSILAGHAAQCGDAAARLQSEVAPLFGLSAPQSESPRTPTSLKETVRRMDQSAQLLLQFTGAYFSLSRGNAALPSPQEYVSQIERVEREVELLNRQLSQYQ